MTLIYPNLPGRAYEVQKTPTWSTRILTAASGRETRMAMWSAPKWEFRLKYEVLRDTPTENELQILLGFFNQQQGSFGSFLLIDPDDNQATGQTIAVGDGTTASFTLVRTFGGYVEPVGAVVGGLTIYVNGARQTSGYSVAGNALTFSRPPASGAVISADFQYAFLVRFKDDAITAERFLRQMWSVGEVNLITVRG